MQRTCKLVGAVILAAFGAGCARYTEAAGDVVGPATAAQTVVLEVRNVSTQAMELRTVYNGESRFVGSIAGQDSASVLLDPQIFPTGSLYLAAIPADGRGRALVGPIAATRGDRIRFTIQPALGMSNATVVR